MILIPHTCTVLLALSKWSLNPFIDFLLASSKWFLNHFIDFYWFLMIFINFKHPQHKSQTKPTPPTEVPTKPTPPTQNSNKANTPNRNSNKTNTTQQKFQQNQHPPTQIPTEPRCKPTTRSHLVSSRTQQTSCLKPQCRQNHNQHRRSFRQNKKENRINNNIK